MRNKKIIAVIAAVSLMIACGTINSAVKTGIPLTVSADETDEGNGEEPGGETPEEPGGEEPEEPGGETPEEPGGEEPEEPAEEPSEPAPEEGNNDPETTEKPSEDDDEDDQDDEDNDDGYEPDNDGRPSGGGRVTSRTKAGTKVTTKSTTTVTTTVSAAAKTVNKEAGISVENKTGDGKLSAGRTFAAAIGAAAIIGAVAAVIVVLKKKGNTKLQYFTGDDVDEANCPLEALGFNAKYGKYNASAITEYEDRIILTFDPDYDAKAMNLILDVLKEKKVSAVFFVNEKCIKEQSKLISRMINEGHIIGSSGMTDESMPDMKNSEVIDSIINIHEKLLKKYGYEMKYFRPPYGEYSKKTLAAARDLGYSTLMWSYEYINDLPDKGESIKDIVDCAHSGAIALFRSAEEKDATVLSDAIDILRSKGFEI